ncbi:2-hydroxychromene-2-carboxylate isomerase [uncultured Enterovirga sp.]|uniref:2-hydroxychromene-2-carboxylate isomerase n=1 Tax=uncultured Enterovirga sp. TaxID=2026352 RepID=UPI0035CA9033
MAPSPSVITYYFWTASDWAYLGHQRLVAMAAKHGVDIDYRPVDLPTIYAQTGGILLGQRSQQRQDYRMAELRRWKARLGDPIVLEPRFFPTDHHPSSRLVAAAKLAGLPVAELSYAVMRAMWVEDRDISDRAVLREVGAGLVPDIDALLAASDRPDVQAEYARYTAEAPGDGVFGSPFYLYDGDILWGQDRLDFLEEALERHSAGA